MIIGIFSFVIILVVLFVGFVRTRPSEFRISRSIAISAPPNMIFPEVNNLHRWEAWSPWAKLDPNAKSSFTGPDGGEGASMSWDGNNKVGRGTMTILESRPSDLVRFRLDFEKPMKATNQAEFTFIPDGSQTAVTWSMSGKNNFMGKFVGLFMDCDRMVGGSFEKGLADLRRVVEGGIPS